MSHDYHLSIFYQGHAHYIDLQQDESSNIVIDGKHYKVLGDDQKMINLFLSHIQSIASPTVKDLTDWELSVKMDVCCQSFEKAGFTGSVLVEKEGKTLLAKGYGSTGVKASTSFYIASLTKQFTAAAIMQLVEKGKLKLDDPINNHLPQEFQSPKWQNVTVHHLLCHTSGILNFTDDEHYAEKAPTMTTDSMLQEMREKDLRFHQGDKFEYSNTGYALLGKIIVQVSGEDYNHYIMTHLLAPAEMSSSSIQPQNDPHPSEHTCLGHILSSNGDLENQSAHDLHMAGAAGGLISTTQDLAKWNHVLDGKTSVLSQSSVDKITTPNIDHYGYGIIVKDEDGHRIIGHSGAIYGFNSNFSRYPDDKLFITVLCNTGDFSANTMTKHLENIAFNRISDTPKPVEHPIDRRYQGRFCSLRDPNLELEFKVTASGSLQRIQYTPGQAPLPFPLYLLSNGRVFDPSDGIEFELKENGKLLAYGSGHSEPFDELSLL